MKKQISFISQHFKNNKKWYFIWILAIAFIAIRPFMNKEEIEYTKANECINQQLELLKDPEVTQLAEKSKDCIKIATKVGLRQGMSIGTFGISGINDYIEDKILHRNKKSPELKLEECIKIISSSNDSVKKAYLNVIEHCEKEVLENDGLSNASSFRAWITDLSSSIKKSN